MDLPTEPGLYWASHIMNATQYDMIIQVAGVAPFLIAREWHNARRNWMDGDLAKFDPSIIKWGPKVEFPKSEDAPAK